MFATNKVAAHLERPGDPLLTELAEEGRVRRLGEIIRSTLNVVSIGVYDGEPFAGKHVLEGGRTIVAVHEVVVVTQRIGHDFDWGTTIVSVGPLIITGEAVPNAGKPSDGVEKVIVGNTHACFEIRAVGWWRPKVFTKEERVVAVEGVFVNGITVVSPVRVTAGEIELLLDLSVVSGAGVVFVGSALLAEKI